MLPRSGRYALLIRVRQKAEETLFGDLHISDLMSSPSDAGLEFGLLLGVCQYETKRNLFHSRMVEAKYDWESGGLSFFDSVGHFSVYFVANTDHLTAQSLYTP